MFVLFFRNMKVRTVRRPGWWNSSTSWRWSCRPTSTRSWRERREDCRSSLTPPMASPPLLLFTPVSSSLDLLTCVSRLEALRHLFKVYAHTYIYIYMMGCLHLSFNWKTFFSELNSLPGRFQHPDVLRFLSSLNEERGRRVTPTEETEKSRRPQMPQNEET